MSRKEEGGGQDEKARQKQQDLNLSDAMPLPPLPPPPPPPKSGMLPHESSLGDLPGMESAPPSANFPSAGVMASAGATTTTASSLPPPPPPPPSKVKMNTAPVPPPPPPPPRSGSSTAGSITADILPPPPRVTPSTTTGSTIVNLPPAPTATAATEAASQPSADLQQPPKLPLGTFDKSHGASLLARRQSQLPILVIGTENAHQVLGWKNGLHDVSEVLQGIWHHTTHIPNLSTFRSLTGHLTLDPKRLGIQFMDPSEDLQVREYEAAHQSLQREAELQDSDGNLAQELILLEDRVELLTPDVDGTEEETLESVVKEAYQLTSGLEIPWLVRYRQALEETTNGLPHECFSTPPVVLYVCTTQEFQDPVEVLKELQASAYFQPECFTNGWMDPKAIRVQCLVLHDVSEGPSMNMEQLMALQQSMSTQLTTAATLINVNSVPSDVAQALMAEETTDLWGGQGRLGSRLSVNDIATLRKFLQNITTVNVLPALENRIAQLNAIVSERKKGVRNLVKSFWRGPSLTNNTPTKTSTGNNVAGSTSTNSPSNKNKSNIKACTVQYRYDSIESQTRLLGDTLFLMKDYEGALSTYRLIRDDFKNDNALLHYASLQEVMGLCLYHMMMAENPTGPASSSHHHQQRKREIFTHWESALLYYTRAAEEERQERIAAAAADSSSGTTTATSRPPTAPHATRLATRLCLLMSLAGSTLTEGRELEVADLLASASSHESPLGAAVLLEQASSFYHDAKMVRKYAFHMLMSGHMFRTAQQDVHAFRCFTCALYIYRHGKWTELHGHLKSALAAQLYSMKRYPVALLLYTKLIEGVSGKVSVKSQQKFLNHLLDICEEHTKAALVGAERMVLPPKNAPPERRNQYHQEYMDRIVQVVKHTPSASRVLELPCAGVPKVHDSSVRVWTHAEEHFLPKTPSSTIEDYVPPVSAIELADDGPALGKLNKGEENVWEELELLTTAEWNAVDSTARGLDETTTSVLSKIQDPHHRRVIAQIDKERQSKALMERNRRKGSLKPKAVSRAKEEPIFCDFVVENPMSVDVVVTQIQLVARMVDDDGTICTNQDPVRLTEDKSDESKTWTFSTSEEQTFFEAEFLRLSEQGSTSSTSASMRPFFVVTKQDVELAGGSKLVVTAGLTALVQGDLEILGVRCKLQDKVWVYHPFDIPGPLLNDTRSNRSSRIRGESLLLKSNISVGMPCITADLIKRPSSTALSSSDGGPLLEGQISHWTLRLKNIGRAAAKQLMLKTNLPWVNIPGGNKALGLSDKELEAEATSNCVGPTGTLLTIPLSEISSAKQEGVIHPGETVDVPIQIRTSGTGKHDFYMLYRYSLHDETDAKLRIRWLRKMYKVPVFPSISLGARVLASDWKDSEHTLSIEVTNNRTDRPTDLYVTLDKLAMASRIYSLEAFQGQFRTAGQVGDVLQIGWQERLTVHYRVIAAEDEKLHSITQLSVSTFMDDTTTTRQKCVESDSMNFLCLQQAWETFESAWTNHQYELFRAEHDPDGGTQPRSIASIRRANTADSTSIPDSDTPKLHPTSIGQLCPIGNSASEIHLLCHWRAILGDEVVHGQHHLCNLSVRPKTKANGCPVHVTAEYPFAHSHDFSKGPAMVSVIATLRNRLVEQPVSLLVVAKPHPSFEMIGLDRLPLSLQPDESVDIPFDVLIHRTGTINLQSLQIQVDQANNVGTDANKENKKALLFKVPQQWLLHVSDASSRATVK